MMRLPTRLPTRLPISAAVCAVALLAGCAQTPNAPPPVTAMSAAFKEAPPGWVLAEPADTQDRGPWWAQFGDPALNALAERVQVSNQTVAAQAAAVAQTQAALREQRAALFPTLGASGGAVRSGGGGATTGASGTRYTLGLQAGWEPDLWGRIRGSVTAAGANLAASEADLAAVRLSAQAELASTYFNLRQADLEAQLLRSTITAYERSLRITGNRYRAGLAPRSDLLQAETQLANAQADLAGTEQQRAQAEHALAVLVGEAPANFSLAGGDWAPPAVPAVGGLLPATLLQRRPDIAAAERRVAAANANIGVARAAYFPAFSFSADGGAAARSVGDLFSASAASWSLGLSLVQTLFDAGARSARVDASRAAWEQTVAQYRQTVLVAFQDVEDQLAAARVLARQEQLFAQAAQAAALTEEQVTNRYNAGQVGFTEVVLAQVSALNARRALLQAESARLVAAVGLVRALGGGWAR